MAFYRTEDGKGWVHIRMMKPPVPCRAPRRPGDDPSFGEYCGRVSSKLCDGPAGVDLAGNNVTCDMPLCRTCATPGGRNIDYCPRHKGLADTGGQHEGAGRTAER